MPSREYVEKVTTDFYNANRKQGKTISRETVRREVVERAKRFERKQENKR